MEWLDGLGRMKIFPQFRPERCLSGVVLGAEDDRPQNFFDPETPASSANFQTHHLSIDEVDFWGRFFWYIFDQNTKKIGVLRLFLV